MRWSTTAALAAAPAVALAQSTCTPITGDLPAPSMAPGYRSDLALTGLKYPRGIQWDSTGHLLVVDRGAGVYRYSVDSCLQLQDQQLIVNDTELSHGISLSTDGMTLFASSKEAVFSWSYDPNTGGLSNKKAIITGMTNNATGGHVTRTLLSPVSQPDWIIVSIGSQSDPDVSTLSVSSGKSQIRAFNVTEISREPVVFHEAGFVLGTGLRNSVGIAEDSMAQLWSVENSIDGVTRNGTEIHENNPAEELNYHGSLLDSRPRGNYGYPNCFAVWAANEIPDDHGLQTGDQFSMYVNGTLNDTLCAEEYQPPRLSFHAHQAPLDIKFDADGQAWISFHGSWNRAEPIGYRVVTVAFKDGQPVESNSSQSAALEIMANTDLTMCQTACFRPAGLAFNPSSGDLWMSSDATGEIYVIRKGEAGTAGSGDSKQSKSGASSVSAAGTWLLVALGLAGAQALGYLL